MKKKKLILVSILLILIASLISGCTGSASMATSWPGLTVSEGTGYLADNAFVYAINLENGSQKWKYPAETEKGKAFFASPILSQDGQLITGGYDHVLYSINAENGTFNWSFTEATDRYIASPLVTSTHIYAPNANGTLYALDLKGALKWTFQAEKPLWAQPVANAECDCVYVASMDHHLYALDAESGSLFWKSPDLGGAVVASPVFGEDGVIFVGTFGNEMLALDANSGEVLWRSPAEEWVWSTASLQDGKLFFGDLKGTFFGLDTAGQALWPSIKTDGSITGAPLVKDEAVYFGTENGSVYSVNPDGSASILVNLNSLVLNEKTLEGKILAPVLDGGDVLLVVPSESNALLVALTPTGSLKWSFNPEK